MLRPDLLVDEPENAAAQDDRQNVIQDDLFNKDIGYDIIVPEQNIDNVKTEEFISDIRPLVETGDQAVNDKNYDDYVKILGALRPDLLVDEPDILPESVSSIKDIPYPEWIRPDDRLKSRVRRSNRKKVYSKDGENSKKVKR